MEPKTELARLRLPREPFGLGEAGASEGVLSSRDCFSGYCDTSDKLDMNEAARRFRSRFDGCESSLLVWMLVSAVRELRPKMLRRLSRDMPRDQSGMRRPARAQRRDSGMRGRGKARGGGSNWHDESLFLQGTSSVEQQYIKSEDVGKETVQSGQQRQQRRSPGI